MGIFIIAMFFFCFHIIALIVSGIFLIDNFVLVMAAIISFVLATFFVECVEINVEKWVRFMVWFCIGMVWVIAILFCVATFIR